MIIGNQFDHQIKRRGATGGRNPISVNDENRFGERHIFELFKKAVVILPVDCGPFAIKQPSLRDRITSSAKASDCSAAPRFAS